MDWIQVTDTIFKVALIPICVAAVAYLAKLVGWKASAEQTEQLKSAVQTGLLNAEATYIAALKQKSIPPTGPEKLQLAISVAREVAKDGLQKYTDQELKRFTEAELVKARPLLSTPPPPSVSVAPPPLGSLMPPV